MLQDIIHTETVNGFYVSILLYSIDKNDREWFDNRNHYYDIRITYNDENDNFDDVFEFIYTKKEAFKLFKYAKEDAVDIYNSESKRVKLGYWHCDGNEGNKNV